MIGVLEGRRSVSLEYLGNLETWILRKADFLVRQSIFESIPGFKKNNITFDFVFRAVKKMLSSMAHTLQLMF